MYHCQLDLLFLSLLLLSFTASGVSSVGHGAAVGSYRPIKNLKDPHVTAIAKFAVTEHNKENGTHLKFMKVVKGESQVVAGINYRLVIAAKDGTHLGDYEAVVYERTWDKYISLTSFKKV